MKIASLILLMCGTLASNAFAQNIFDNYDLCKAAISSEMGRPVSSMMNLRSTSNSPEITYTRKEDGSKYRYNCQIEGNKIIWRAYFNDSVQVGWGRWRNGEWDSIITFSTIENELTILNSSTDITQSFQKKDF